ncbi:MAG: oxidoreductase [Flavobacterium sp. BFFFF1]|uniref:Gfo/Idh/MocA family oxidoreductase n=1 Tax=Flavobacterium sp. BFFFF1 TaxID=2015557 RepID=UPI000BDBEECD|nr:Gfo/Idh/MocA family oxidoreductase [Flavobacterium sp. BFFFF1]OYU80894.1 MAG: oxidoreductase [Flavobacterium sp. BFFFF1]
MQKIKTALLSYGMSGKVFHAPFLSIHPGYELLGSWERTHKHIKSDYPEVKSYNSFKELIDDGPDLVVINTPVSTHYEYAKKAMLAGKHVLVEKSFTATLDEAEDLKKIASKKGVKLAVFHNRRWDSDFLTVKDVLSKNLLGDVVEAEFHFDRYNPSLSPKIHKETPNKGAGILKDLGSHLIDQALSLFGVPDAVFADIRITRPQSVVDDCIDVLLYYQNLRVRLKAGFFVREMVPSFVVHGKNGSFLKQRGDVQEEDLKIGKKINPKTWGIEPRSKEGLLHTEFKGKIIRDFLPTFSGNYYTFFDLLYDAIANNAVEPVTAQDGINVMKVIEAAIKSNKDKKIVRIS